MLTGQRKRRDPKSSIGARQTVVCRGPARPVVGRVKDPKVRCPGEHVRTAGSREYCKRFNRRSRQCARRPGCAAIRGTKDPARITSDEKSIS